MPVAWKPALPNSTARGNPTYPSPTTPVRARRLFSFSRSVSASADIHGSCSVLVFFGDRLGNSKHSALYPSPEAFLSGRVETRGLGGRRERAWSLGRG